MDKADININLAVYVASLPDCSRAIELLAMVSQNKILACKNGGVNSRFQAPPISGYTPYLQSRSIT